MAQMTVGERARLAWRVFRGEVPRLPQRKQAPFAWPLWRNDQPAWQLIDLDNYISEGFNQNTLIYSAVMYKVRAGMTARLRAYHGEVEAPELLKPNHPLSQLLDRPNPHQSWDEFQGQQIVYLNIAGNCYVYMDRARGKGLPSAMWGLRPDRVFILPDAKRGIRGYVYVPEGKSAKDGVPMLPQDVMHVKFPNPGDPLEGMGYGLSPISPLARSADVDNKITDFLKMFFDSGTMMTVLLKFDVSLDDGTVARIRDRWKEIYGGYENWTVPGVIDQGGDVQRMGMTFHEMGFETLDERNESRILGPFGVPPILIGSRIGLARATYANYEEARKAFWQDTFVPELRLFENEYRYYLQTDDGGFVAFDLSDVPALRANTTEQVQNFVSLVQVGVPKGLAAEVVGLALSNLPDANVTYMPSSLTPVGADGLPIAPPEPKAPPMLPFGGQGEGTEDEGRRDEGRRREPDEEMQGASEAEEQGEEAGKSRGSLQRKEGDDEGDPGPFATARQRRWFFSEGPGADGGGGGGGDGGDGATGSARLSDYAGVPEKWSGTDGTEKQRDYLTSLRDREHGAAHNQGWNETNNRAIDYLDRNGGVNPASWNKDESTALAREEFASILRDQSLHWMDSLDPSSMSRNGLSEAIDSLKNGTSLSLWTSAHTDGSAAAIAKLFNGAIGREAFTTRGMASGGERLIPAESFNRYNKQMDSATKALALTVEQKAEQWKAWDRTARKWEARFEEGAAEVFRQQLRELAALMAESREKASTVAWSKVLLRWQDYLAMAGLEGWRKAFVPLLMGIIQDQADRWTATLGMQFDVRNLLGEAWFDRYVLKFAQPINDVTLKVLGQLLQTAERDGWSIPQMQKGLEAAFDYFLGKELTEEERAWFEERLPAHRTELIARTETMRASNAGSMELFQEYGAKRKEWLSTKDDRTRSLEKGDEFEHLADWPAGPNGQVVGMDEPFEVSGEKLMFPGDPDGSLGNTLNCRCTVLPVVE